MNAAVTMQNCPTEETLAAFLDGSLDEKARLEVIEHLADCAECRDIVMAADEYRSTLRAVEPATTDEVVQPAQTAAAVVSGPFGWRMFAPLAAAAAVVAVLFGVPSVRERIFEPDGMAELVKAANAQAERPTPARLSGDFAYKPNHNMRGGPEESAEPQDNYLVDYAAAKSRERAEKRATADNLHARGVAEILMKNRTEAVKVLEEAAKASPTSADILTDLAAAYIADGDYQRAYDAATKAWSIEQTPAAAWNIAVSLQDAGKYAEAIAAWQKYLKLDSNSEWSAEAKRHLEDVQMRLEDLKSH